jgi:hypothetical protein
MDELDADTLFDSIITYYHESGYFEDYMGDAVSKFS